MEQNISSNVFKFFKRKVPAYYGEIFHTAQLGHSLRLLSTTKKIMIIIMKCERAPDFPISNSIQRNFCELFLIVNYELINLYIIYRLLKQHNVETDKKMSPIPDGIVYEIIRLQKTKPGLYQISCSQVIISSSYQIVTCALKCN